ncbi:MAG: replication initiation protein [Pseudonocardia sp.]|nr:replication initiation protein [Pseudonocardia sp.]
MTTRDLPRVQRMRMPLAVDVVRDLAREYGVCVRPLPRRRVDMVTGESTVVPLPCGSTRGAVCQPCADKARRLRMVQCREGWHLDDEPLPPADDPTAEQKAIAEYRARLEAVRVDAPPGQLADIDSAVVEADEWLADLGVRGTPATTPTQPGGTAPARRVRSTRRRQDTPDLPRLPVEARTVGRVYTGRDGTTWRPSTFITLTCDTYGRVRHDGTPVDPATYDYQRAARDAIHFAALVDRWWQNLRRAAGFDVQYFAAVEPQRRLAPHLHAAVRGTIPRTLIRQVTAATYHHVWWPPCDQPVYPDRPPTWDPDTAAYVDPDTRRPLPTWNEALDQLDTDPHAEPAHVARFGVQVDVQGVLGDTDRAARCIGYLTKYLTKNVDECHTPTTAAQRAHVDRLADALRHEPCSTRCANWLRYGVQPDNPRAGLIPGQCRGKAHRRDTLGHAGRRVLVSRRWSGKTLTDHRADRRTHVLRVLGAAHTPATTPPENPGRWEWQPVHPDDTDAPARGSLLLRAIGEQARWRSQYRWAQAHPAPPDVPATLDRAA